MKATHTGTTRPVAFLSTITLSAAQRGPGAPSPRRPKEGGKVSDEKCHQYLSDGTKPVF